MAVTVERVQGFALDFTNNPDLPSTISDAATNYAFALWSRRANAIAAPTRNGDSFTALFNGANYGSYEVYGQVPDVGTFNVLTSATEFRMSAGVWLVLAGVDTTTPLGTPVTEIEDGASWSAPSLSPSGSAGDLLVSVLMTANWNVGFGDTSGATVSIGGAQTLIIDRPSTASPGIGEGRVIVTTAPVGSTMSYTFSGGAQPNYNHFAVAVKAAGGGGGGGSTAALVRAGLNAAGLLSLSSHRLVGGC